MDNSEALKKTIHFTKEALSKISHLPSDCNPSNTLEQVRKYLVTKPIPTLHNDISSLLESTNAALSVQLEKDINRAHRRFYSNEMQKNIAMANAPKCNKN